MSLIHSTSALTKSCRGSQCQPAKCLKWNVNCCRDNRAGGLEDKYRECITGQVCHLVVRNLWSTLVVRDFGGLKSIRYSLHILKAISPCWVNNVVRRNSGINLWINSHIVCVGLLHLVSIILLILTVNQWSVTLTHAVNINTHSELSYIKCLFVLTSLYTKAPIHTKMSGLSLFLMTDL